ncbi:MAG: hypothetical protein K0R03_2401, partial [Moraxellaceae bacterium]|nr:hypothetical protein [Moraxellaceae bacterium]
MQKLKNNISHDLVIRIEICVFGKAWS